MKPTFFATPAEFRRWLAKHHADTAELLVGFHRRESGKPSLTWPESVDEALCFGWIDGVRQRIDDVSYCDPLHAAQGRLHLERDQHRQGREARTGGAHDGRRSRLPTPAAGRTARGSTPTNSGRRSCRPSIARVLDANRAAAADFDARPAWYRKTAIWKIVSAKQEATRQRRLAQLVDCHTRGELIPELRRTPKTP